MSDAHIRMKPVLKAEARLEDVVCNLCGSDDSRLRYRSDPDGSPHDRADFAATTDRFGAYGSVRECTQCGLVYTSPRLDTTAVLQGYSDVEDDEYLSESDARCMNAYLALARIRRHVPAGRLLEVGCATGFFLNAARISYQVTGLEPSHWATKHAHEKLGLEVAGATLGEVRFPDAHFDVVALIDVLEHLTDPLETMREVARITRPGGVTYIVTPDIGSLSARVLRGKWWGLRPAHIYYFSRRTLKALLMAAGFEVVWMDSYGRIFTWQYWLSRLANYPSAVRSVAAYLVRALGIEDKFLYLDTRDSVQVIARR